MIPASRFKRLIAYSIDIILLSILMTTVAIILIIGEGSFIPLIKDHGLFIGFSPEFQSIGDRKFFQIISFIVFLLYFVLLESSKYQGTLGKKLLGLYVSDSVNKRISVLRALGRFILWEIPLIPIYMIPHEYQKFHGTDWWWFSTFCILYLIWILPIFFTQARTTLYDMLSSTRVNKRIRQ